MSIFKELTGLDDPSCWYKFNWSTIRLWTNDTASCHRCTYEDLPENFDDFHNTPGKIQNRMDMASGKWCGDGCEYCRDIEAVDGISDRKDVNYSKNFAEKISPDLLNNVTVTPRPTVVEVYFNNRCNMKCIYCNSGFSSSWEKEDAIYGKIRGRQTYKEGYEERVNKWFEWLRKNGNTLVEYNFLGGEPFYQDEMDLNIEFFEKHPHPDLKFRIFSNFKVNHNKFKKCLERLSKLVKDKHLHSVRIISSIDCWDYDQEYVRTGFKMKQWKENMDTLIYDFPLIEVHCHGTMCALTTKTAYKLTQILCEYNRHRSILQTYNLLVSPQFMQNSVFPYGFFDEDIEILSKEMAKMDPYRATQILKYKDEFNSKEYRPDMIKQLISYLEEMDRRRKTNWQTAFPWLAQFVSENFIELSHND